MNPQVDKYLIDGCMRCKLGATPACKVNQWQPELVALRQIVLACGLNEELKWGMPCYTLQGKNIVMISAFKEYCSLNFFQGALINDPHKILEQQGANSQAIRIVKFTPHRTVHSLEEKLKAYIAEAKQLSSSGAKVVVKKNPEPIPQELQDRLNHNDELKEAFEALTPGRQRGYILHISQPKQSQTRESRIDKCTALILRGEGLNDNYKQQNRK